MKGKRQSTVEPVFGTLTQFIELRKINTIGINLISMTKSFDFVIEIRLLEQENGLRNDIK